MDFLDLLIVTLQRSYLSKALKSFKPCSRILWRFDQNMLNFVKKFSLMRMNQVPGNLTMLVQSAKFQVQRA